MVPLHVHLRQRRRRAPRPQIDFLRRGRRCPAVGVLAQRAGFHLIDLCRGREIFILRLRVQPERTLPLPKRAALSPADCWRFRHCPRAGHGALLLHLRAAVVCRVVVSGTRVSHMPRFIICMLTYRVLPPVPKIAALSPLQTSGRVRLYAEPA